MEIKSSPMETTNSPVKINPLQQFPLERFAATNIHDLSIVLADIISKWIGCYVFTHNSVICPNGWVWVLTEHKQKD